MGRSSGSAWPGLRVLAPGKLIALWAAQRFRQFSSPYGTLIVNLTGCFLIAMIMQAATITAWSTLRSAL